MHDEAVGPRGSGCQRMIIYKHAKNLLIAAADYALADERCFVCDKIGRRYRDRSSPADVLASCKAVTASSAQIDISLSCNRSADQVRQFEVSMVSQT